MAPAPALWRLSTTMHLEPITFLPRSYWPDRQRKRPGGRTRIALANVGGGLQLTTHIPVRVIEYRSTTSHTSETFRLDHHHRGPAGSLRARARRRPTPTMGNWKPHFAKSRTYLRVGKRYHGRKHRELVHRKYGACLSPTMRSAPSCPKLPTRSKWTPIDYLSPRTLHNPAPPESPIHGIFPQSPNTKLHERDIGGNSPAAENADPEPIPGSEKGKPSHLFNQEARTPSTAIQPPNHPAGPADYPLN